MTIATDGAPGRTPGALPLTIRHVRRRYGPVVALDDVSLDVAAGEFLTLLGPSGSGKTTLLMVLAGFVRPDAGSLRFGETEMALTPPHRRGVGMVFQNYALFPHMSVAANVAYPLKLRGVVRAERLRRAEAALAMVQLQGYGERRIDQLSGGQRQRVALARAIVFEPRILLMDEPLSALDKKLREHMQIEIRHLHERLGMTTIYVTHDQREALTMSDRVAVMSAGRIIQIDTPRGLYERPRSRFVADFVGESTFLPVRLADGQILLHDQPLRVTHRPEGAGPFVLAVRPETLRLLRHDQAGEGLNVLQAHLQEVVYQGESCLVVSRLAGGTQIALRQSTRREVLEALPPPGTPVRLAFHPDDTLLVEDAR